MTRRDAGPSLDTTVVTVCIAVILLTSAVGGVFVPSLGGGPTADDTTVSLLSDRETVNATLTAGQSTEQTRIETRTRDCGDGCTELVVELPAALAENANSSHLTIGHRTDGSWELLNTTAVTDANGTVVLTAPVAGFSPFGVFDLNGTENGTQVVTNDTALTVVEVPGPNGSSPTEPTGAGAVGNKTANNATDETNNVTASNSTVDERGRSNGSSENASNATDRTESPSDGDSNATASESGSDAAGDSDDTDADESGDDDSSDESDTTDEDDTDDSDGSDESDDSDDSDSDDSDSGDTDDSEDTSESDDADDSNSDSDSESGSDSNSDSDGSDQSGSSTDDSDDSGSNDEST